MLGTYFFCVSQTLYDKEIGFKTKFSRAACEGLGLCQRAGSPPLLCQPTQESAAPPSPTQPHLLKGNRQRHHRGGPQGTTSGDREGGQHSGSIPGLP